MKIGCCTARHIARLIPIAIQIEVHHGKGLLDSTGLGENAERYPEYVAATRPAGMSGRFIISALNSGSPFNPTIEHGLNTSAKGTAGANMRAAVNWRDGHWVEIR